MHCRDPNASDSSHVRISRKSSKSWILWSSFSFGRICNSFSLSHSFLMPSSSIFMTFYQIFLMSRRISISFPERRCQQERIRGATQLPHNWRGPSPFFPAIVMLFSCTQSYAVTFILLVLQRCKDDNCFLFLHHSSTPKKMTQDRIKDSKANYVSH